MSSSGHLAASGVAASSSEQQNELSELLFGKARPKYQHGLRPNLEE
jgi:hypothetical protein